MQRQQRVFAPAEASEFFELSMLFLRVYWSVLISCMSFKYYSHDFSCRAESEHQRLDASTPPIDFSFLEFHAFVVTFPAA
jgi:hypothetical protein